METEKKLVATGLSKEYPTPAEPLVVLRGVDLELGAGQSLSITGPSGCGKSTLLHLLGALDEPTSGTVVLDGVDPFSLTEKALAGFRNQRVGFVFQEHHLLPQLDVLENVLVPTLVGEGASGAVATRARDLLDRVGLANRLTHHPAELSGGERQRVAVARALVQQPDLLLCDEPTGNLDADSAAQVGDLLLELHRELQNILIVVTHSLELAGRMERRLELSRGRLGAPQGAETTAG